MLPSGSMIDIGANLAAAAARVAAAAARAGRGADSVTVMAVTKTVGVEEMKTGSRKRSASSPVSRLRCSGT
jgi:uncharacterized pyridoxal phosphate-containing UPF0001 family protein